MPEAKRLFILRHAKSSWDDPSLGDHDRPLAPRGQRACKAMAEYLRKNAVAPELVLCSSARRTRETLAGIGVAGDHVIESELYAATTGDLIDRLHRVPDDVGSVMLIGHNPALQMLVLRLARRDPEAADARAAVERKFPTAALATLTFECAWSELGSGSARLAGYLTPRELNGPPEAGAAVPGHRA